jgi:hypothetical protein
MTIRDKRVWAIAAIALAIICLTICGYGCGKVVAQASTMAADTDSGTADTADVLWVWDDTIAADITVELNYEKGTVTYHNCTPDEGMQLHFETIMRQVKEAFEYEIEKALEERCHQHCPCPVRDIWDDTPYMPTVTP